MIYICLECEATPLRPPRISRPSFFNPLAGLGLPQRLPQVGSAGNCCGLQLEERTESMESEDRRPIAWKYLHRQVETLVKPPSTRPLHTHAALFSLRWSGSRLDLGYIILLSCNYEMCRADLEPNEQEESPEEGCTHAEKKQQQKPKKPELHRKLRLLCAGLLWIKSRAERAAKNIKKYNSFLRLSVGFTSASSAAEESPLHHSSCVWQMPTSNILNYDNHLSLMFISWLGFLFRGCWSPIQIGYIRECVCWYGVTSRYNRHGRGKAKDRSKRSLAQFSKTLRYAVLWGLI